MHAIHDVCRSNEKSLTVKSFFFSFFLFLVTNPARGSQWNSKKKQKSDARTFLTHIRFNNDRYNKTHILPSNFFTSYQNEPCRFFLSFFFYSVLFLSFSLYTLNRLELNFARSYIISKSHCIVHFVRFRPHYFLRLILRPRRANFLLQLLKSTRCNVFLKYPGRHEKKKRFYMYDIHRSNAQRNVFRENNILKFVNDI